MKNRICMLVIGLLSVLAFGQKYDYKTFENDPTGLRLYTLDNGLTVYLAQNKDEPKIQTFMAVRAGSVYDPADNTGLAHYLEHMLFKGTDEIATIDWEKEKVLLQQISDLYEKHKAEKDPEKKKAIYKEIDSISYIASKLTVANEYDKIISSMGAEGTNAHTWHEETVYKNKIPANELEKWLGVESERYSQLVLRLFHTELEAVYEEFNRAQDNDWRKKYYKMGQLLFPTHPYGQQTTIGTSEHLKNPSMEAIHNYFETYYVPNNMALVLVGDLDFDKTIALVDAYFGGMKPKPVTKPTLPKEKPMTSVVSGEVSGPTPESVMMAYRFEGRGSTDEKMVTLIDMILSNSKAGLLDLELNQKQKVQDAGCSPTFLNDYGMHTFNVMPKEGQTMDEAKDLVLEQIEKVKKGEFDDWMIEAVINDLKFSEIRQYDNATAVASMYYDNFIGFQNWQNQVNFIDDLRKITKEELVKFAQEHYKNNYAIVYKKQGENSDIYKVENPGITPIHVNREDQSAYFKKFIKKEAQPLQPLFLDYDKTISKSQLKNGMDFYAINNPSNDLFYVNYIWDMGEQHDKLLPLAIQYAEYLGTDELSPEELQKEFYKLGISFSVNAGDYRTYVYLTGLKENRKKGLELFEKFLKNVKPNAEAYQLLIEKIKKERKDEKTSKGSIFWNGLYTRALYGPKNDVTERLSIEELESTTPEQLTNLIKEMTSYPHYAFYYGKDKETAAKELAKIHKYGKNLKEFPARKKYEVQTPKGEVFYTHYDMVQSEICFLTPDVPFDKKNMALIEVFNDYFGGGLSSIVFQEIRESKSLAYSAWSYYATPDEKGDKNIVYGYIGTQANKLPQAVDALMELMNDMPEAEVQFQASKESALKRIEAQRITKSSIFWNYMGNKDLGIDYDIRKEVYEQIKKMTLADLKNFFNQHIKGKKYNIIVIGNEKDMDVEALKKLGSVQELKPEELFKD